MNIASASRELFCKKNAANMVTLIRFLLVGWVSLLLWIKPDENRFLIFILIIVAGITDYLDGKIAKKLNIQSGLGSDLDKAGDKFFIVVMFSWLFNQILKSIWQTNRAGLVLIIFMMCWGIGIEALLIWMWFRCKAKKIDSSAYWSGQVKMALYFIAVDWWFLCWAFEGLVSFQIIYFIFGLILFGACFFSYFSLQSYYQRYEEAIKKGASL